MSKHMPLLLAFTLLAVGSPGVAQDDASRPQSSVYQVQQGSAADLASVLKQHFPKEAGAVFVAEPVSNTLLISAQPSRMVEILDLLRQMDRRPRTIGVEVLLLEVRRKSDPNRVEQDLDARMLSGPSAEVLGRIEALKKEGRITSLKHTHLTTLESQPSTIAMRESKPVVVGVSSRGGFPGASTVNYQDTGTSVAVTPRISPDGQVQLELQVEDSKVHAPDEDSQPAELAPGVRAQEIGKLTSKTRLNVPFGQAVVVSGMHTTGKSQRTATFIIVICRPEGMEGRPVKPVRKP